MEVVTCGLEDDEDPFLACLYSEQQALIDKTMNTEKCAVDEYVNGNDDLGVCTDLDSQSWDENFLAQIGPDGHEMPEVTVNDVE